LGGSAGSGTGPNQGSRESSQMARNTTVTHIKVLNRITRVSIMIRKQHGAPDVRKKKTGAGGHLSQASLSHFDD
jgi:hypothetical protein